VSHETEPWLTNGAPIVCWAPATPNSVLKILRFTMGLPPVVRMRFLLSSPFITTMSWFVSLAAAVKKVAPPPTASQRVGRTWIDGVPIVTLLAVPPTALTV